MRSQILNIISSFVHSSSISSAKIIIVIFPCRVRSTLSITWHIHNQLRIQPSIYKRRLPVIDTQRVSIDTSNNHSRSTELDPFYDHRGSCVDSFDGRQLTWESHCLWPCKVSPRFHLQSDIDHLPPGTTVPMDEAHNATMALVRPTYVWITVRLALCDRSRFPLLQTIRKYFMGSRTWFST
ncbi:hypothetical protein EDD22DRAFT_857727 [Suillus occidentalis]|nr:hypothetical protein EDD22DRAFT_857727 [Suillus occidentalis]